ncbi:uncharacterized protein LOC127849703 [Dreissena polymorpha]|uniref:Uncharacterized protein n=1 Tax=Dreissena polymorpha TaxID=45954 RepID=A0A9D4D0I3_DREPO|nr:uncharacterized protein LOC127849703 [Dreissena polymorpha]KAH3735710.1 hypothetical protein DPMN_042245 [Dreissena polymorpha]
MFGVFSTAIALFIVQISNVVVAGPPPAQATAPLLVAQLEMNGWNLVFRATSGNGQNVYSAWMTGQNASTTKPIDMSRSYSSHFRQENLNATWANINATYVKFALYRDNREVGYVIFDAQGSDFSNWFAKGRVVDASWSDLTKTATYNGFSIYGDVRATIERRFLINNVYGECPGDIGHVAVIERDGSCNMDKHPSYPQFVYADLNSADMWQKQQFGRADYMAIFVSH